MKDFINKLSEKFEIDIISSDKFKHGTNSYRSDENGNITELYLFEVKLKSVDVLLPLKEYLIEMRLEDCEISNLKSVHEFSNLIKLNLCFNPITSAVLEELKPMDSLKFLGLSYTDIDDTTVISKMEFLEELHLGDCINITSVNGLEELHYLTNLNIDSTYIESLADISASNSIERISYRDNCLNRISSLENFPNLKELIITGQNISKIEGLENCNSLKKLRLSTTRINKIEGLDKLINLEVLNLNHNELSNISGLNKLANLKKLNLSENQISEVKNLDGLKNLELLLLESCGVTQFNTEFLFELNSECLISLVRNPIKQIDKSIPDNVTIQFESDHWVPKSI